MGVRGWNELGVVGTIYEEDDEEDSFSSSSSTIPSLEFTPSPSPWKMGMRNDPDVVIHVQDSCFHLHKEALISRSAYLRRKLSKFPEIILSPPLNITAQTFSSVAEFCYGAHLALSPSNVAALQTAAELLGMMETDGPGDQNLLQVTEEYFRREVAVNEEHLCTVIRSCFRLMPEAETAVFLLIRCVEALSLTAGGDGDLSCLDGIKGLAVEDFQLVLDLVSQRLTDCHDLVYRIIDIYLKENIDKLSDDQKIQMCNHIDCAILSPEPLMHAVRNPRMPLRFVVQAMVLLQLSTRHNIISAAPNDIHPNKEKHHDQEDTQNDPITLGAILERDAALRQVSQLKSIMSTTNSRIQSLEKELSGMRRLMSESESIRSRVDQARSASFRFSSESNSNSSHKIERGERGSVSALSLRNVKSREITSSSEESCSRVEKGLGRRLVSGLKSAFGLQRKKREGEVKNRDKLEGGDGNILNDNNNNNNIVIIKKDLGFHRRTSSHS